MTQNEKNEMEKVNFGDLPIGEGDGKYEDVEFSEELADDADRKAAQRATDADQRARQRDLE